MAVAHDAKKKKEREREEISIYKNKENNIASSLAVTKVTSMNRYGVMVYRTYYIQCQQLANYKILYTSSNINSISEYIKKYIIQCIKSRSKRNLLFYNLDSINPSSVSYHFITSSNYPYVLIIIDCSINLCLFYGNKNLYKKLYTFLDFLEKYRIYKDSLQKLSKNQLLDIYNELYYSRPVFIRKKSIYKALLKHQKNIILTT